MSNPFRYLDAITWTKDESWAENDDNDYVPFLINRHLSNFPDSVMYANDLNMKHHLSKQMQFVFLVNTLPKRKRFGKWNKKTETADIKVISVYFDVNQRKAADLLPLVSEQDLNVMRQYYEHTTGGGARNVRRGKAKRA